MLIYKKMNIIETFLNGNLKDAKKLSKNRSFFWLCARGEELGLRPLQRWNIAMYLKGLQSWEDYNESSILWEK
jgi:hypothetical protein